LTDFLKYLQSTKITLFTQTEPIRSNMHVHVKILQQINTLNYLRYMTVHSVSCIAALSIAAVIRYPTGYRHSCIP